MHVPGAFFAINPGDGAAELSDEIVATRLVGVPPAAGNALGTRDQYQLGLRDAARRGDEPRRPRAGLHEIMRIPVARLDAPPRGFGSMVGKRRHAIHGVAAKPRLQPFDQLRPLLGLGYAVAKEPAACAAERREVTGFERNGLYRLLENKRRELLAQQCRQALGVARGSSKLHRYGAFRAIAMHEEQRECPHAGLARGEQARKRHEQAARREQQCLGVIYFRRQLERSAEALRRHEKLARLGNPAERLVELVEELRPAALGEAITRQRQQLPEAGDTNGGKKSSIDAQYFERQLLECKTTAARAPERRSCTRRRGE